MNAIIIDLENNPIEVTDLDKAIAQADDFRTMRHIKPICTELDDNLNNYWDDVYNKLLKLKTT